MTNMTFAPGWIQTIDTDGVREREDLLSYISDTYKALAGFRPRWEGMGEWSIEKLRVEAAQIEEQVLASIERQKARAIAQAEEDARIHLIHAEARKPLASTYQPFADLKELLV